VQDIGPKYTDLIKITSGSDSWLWKDCTMVRRTYVAVIAHCD